jgi:hypothetical protein
MRSCSCGASAMKGLRGRVADLLDNAGLSEQVGIEMYLKPALEATETIYAQKNGKFRDKREVIAWGPRLTALKELFLLHGSYAPRDPKATEQFGIKVVVVDIPRPPKHHAAIDVEPSGNGKPPGENNEDD